MNATTIDYSKKLIREQFHELIPEMHETTYFVKAEGLLYGHSVYIEGNIMCDFKKMYMTNEWDWTYAYFYGMVSVYDNHQDEIIYEDQITFNL